MGGGGGEVVVVVVVAVILVMSSLFFFLVSPMTDLKLKFSKYPSIHTNYIISHCTTFTIIIIIFDTVLRQKRMSKRER